MLSGPGHRATGNQPCWISALLSQLTPRVGRRHGNAEPSCSADASCSLEYLFLGYSTKGPNPASESATLKRVSWLMEKEKQNEAELEVKWVLRAQNCRHQSKKTSLCSKHRDGLIQRLMWSWRWAQADPSQSAPLYSHHQHLLEVMHVIHPSCDTLFLIPVFFITRRSWYLIFYSKCHGFNQINLSVCDFRRIFKILTFLLL